jgi:heme/copper-type cytochrome/quinol oxidase subunit 3
LAAISSLPKPWAASRIIFARITLKYANVYFDARRFNSCSSFGAKTILYGLFFGMDNLLGYQHAIKDIEYQAKNTLVYL